MTSIQLFNELNGKEVSRNYLQEILHQAKTENQTDVIYRVSKILNDYPNTKHFDINIVQYPQGLAGAMHTGDYREALDDCGRLKKGWKFVKGNVVKVEKKDKKEVSKPKKQVTKTEKNECKTCGKKYKFLIYKTQTSNKYTLAFSFADLADENKSVFDFRKTHKGNGYNEFFVTNNVTLLEKYKKGVDYLILSKEDFEQKEFYKLLEKQEVEHKNIFSENNPSEESNEKEAFLQKHKDIPSLEVILRYAQPYYEDSKINKIGQKRDPEPNIIFWKKKSEVRPETNEMILTFKGITKHPLFSKENYKEYVLFRFNKKAEAIFDQWQKILEKNECKTCEKSKVKGTENHSDYLDELYQKMLKLDPRAKPLLYKEVAKKFDIHLLFARFFHEQSRIYDSELYELILLKGVETEMFDKMFAKDFARFFTHKESVFRGKREFVHHYYNDFSKEIGAYIFKNDEPKFYKDLSKKSKTSEKSQDKSNEIRILKTSSKGAMLITDSNNVAWIMKKQRRADGTFTDGALKSLQVGEPYSEEKHGNIAERDRQRAEEKENLQKNNQHEITFYSDYKLGTNRFAITDENGEPLWYGKDFDDPSSQAQGELNAGKKAVWLAGKVREMFDLPSIKLTLNVDAQWLTYQSNPKQKGYELKRLAEKYNVILNAEWVNGKDNPADEYTTKNASGYKKWSDVSIDEFRVLVKQKGGLSAPCEGLTKREISKIAKEETEKVLKRNVWDFSDMPDELIQEIRNWKIISKSPYSHSYYNDACKSCNYTTEGSLRVSDHWNFMSRGEIHCPTDVEVKNGNWILAQYKNGVYHVIKDYGRASKSEIKKREELEDIYRAFIEYQTLKEREEKLNKIAKTIKSLGIKIENYKDTKKDKTKLWDDIKNAFIKKKKPQMTLVKGIYTGSGSRTKRVGSEKFFGTLIHLTNEFATIDKNITSKEFSFDNEKIRDLFQDLEYNHLDVFRKYILEKKVSKKTKEKISLSAPQPQLSTDDFKKMTVKELREFTLQYYLQNLKGKKAVIKKYLKEVIFTTQAGRKIAKGEAMYSAKAVAVKHLQKLIENSTYNNFGQRKTTDSKDILGYLNFKSKLIIDGEKRHLRIALTLFSNRKTELKNIEVGNKRKSVKPTQAPVANSETIGFNRLSQNKNTKKSVSNKKKDENFGLGLPQEPMSSESADPQVFVEEFTETSQVHPESINPLPAVAHHRKGSLAQQLANAPEQTESYQIDHVDMAQFLGDMEIKNTDSLVITLTGGQGSGKTRFAFQFMNDLAQRYKVGHISIEEHPKSRLYIEKAHQYLNQNALNNIEAHDVRSLSEIDKIIRENEVIVIDSFQKIKEIDSKFEVDKDLRKKYNGKLFLVIFQQTTDGKMRGGSKSQFDGDIILFTEKFPNYQENYVYPDKNRYNSIPADQLKYNIFQQRLLPIETEEQTTENQVYDVIY